MPDWSEKCFHQKQNSDPDEHEEDLEDEHEAEDGENSGTSSRKKTKQDTRPKRFYGNSRSVVVQVAPYFLWRHADCTVSNKSADGNTARSHLVGSPGQVVSSA